MLVGKWQVVLFKGCVGGQVIVALLKWNGGGSVQVALKTTPSLPSTYLVPAGVLEKGAVPWPQLSTETRRLHPESRVCNVLQRSSIYCRSSVVNSNGTE